MSNAILDKILSEFLLLILLSAGWYFGDVLHKRPRDGSMIIVRLPKIIGRFFGAKSDDSQLNYHAFMFQVLILVYFIVMSLRTFEFISEPAVYYALLIPIAALTITGIILYAVQRK